MDAHRSRHLPVAERSLVGHRWRSNNYHPASTVLHVRHADMMELCERDIEQHCRRVEAARRSEAESLIFHSEMSIRNWKDFQNRKVRRAQRVLTNRQEQRRKTMGLGIANQAANKFDRPTFISNVDMRRRRASNLALRCGPDAIAALVNMKYV